MVVKTGVKDFFNFELFKSINLNRRGRLLALAGYKVSYNRVKQADIEYKVDPYYK